MFRYIFYLLLIVANIKGYSKNNFVLNIPVTQALLIDVTTDSILYAKNANKLLQPSSMLKTMTAYMVFTALKNGTIHLDDKFIISQKAWQNGSLGSRSFFKVGEKISVQDLLRGLIVQSGNDAAVALAEGIAGSEEIFAQLMQQKAHAIGAKTALITNASGLPDNNTLMSAYDLAIIAQKTITDFPQYYHMYKEISFTYNGIKQNNRNPLLYDDDIGCDGLKTGQTDAAGFSLVASVQKDGRRLIMVINGCKSKAQRAIIAKRLMQWGLNFFVTKVLFKANKDIIGYAKTWAGKENNIALVAAQDIKVTVPKILANKVKIRLIYDSPILAPIQAGQKIAKLIISVPNQREKIYDLIAAKTIESKSIFGRFIDNIKALIWGDNFYSTLTDKKLEQMLQKNTTKTANNVYKGKFITLEGGEGTGKSTQIQKISDYLTKKNIDHIVTHEPGGTPTAEKIRNILVNGQISALDSLSEYLLFSAARRDHLEKIIKPALLEGKWVLCDRFYDSSYVYQGLVQGVSLDFIKQVYQQISNEDLMPDLTFILDMNSEISLKRAKQRNQIEGRFEKQGLSFHKQVRNGFLKVVGENPQRCVKIEANNSLENIFTAITNKIDKLILQS